MKKKLLSLMMAATMVATGTVSAFAKDYQAPEDSEINSQVTITGDVANDSGLFLPGTISVSVPTTASFQVDQNGKFQGSTINVENMGTIPVSVSVDSFVDTNNTAGINIVGRSSVVADPTNTDRTKVCLNLQGNRGTIYFSSSDKTGFGNLFTNEDATIAAHSADDKKVAVVASGQVEQLTLSGDAGKKPNGITQPVQDKFTLTLKIAKSN